MDTIWKAWGLRIYEVQGWNGGAQVKGYLLWSCGRSVLTDMLLALEDGVRWWYSAGGSRVLGGAILEVEGEGTV